MNKKIVQWLFFSVVIATSPIIFNLFKSLGRGEELSMSLLIGRGELLLISSAICAAAIGELFGSSEGNILAKLIIGGSCLILLILSAMWFADISAAIYSSEYINTDRVSTLSLIFFILSIITSGLSKFFTEA